MPPSPDPSWRDARVLVTGGTGLLGERVVANLLDAGAEVTVLCRDRASRRPFWQTDLPQRAHLAWGDVRDQALVERVLGEHEVSVVLHLAAQTLVQVAARNPASTWATNVGGTAAVLEACRRSPLVQSVVVASSDKVYGENPAVVTEDAPLLATGPYAASKVAAEAICRSYAETWGLPVAWTRCANFFGPGDRHWSRLVPSACRSALRSEAPVLRSDGEAVRDWLFVEDGAAGTLALAAALRARPGLAGRAYNLSMERPLTVAEMARAVLHAAGRPDTLDVRDEASGELRHQALDCTRARDAVGFSAPTPLDDALRQTLTGYRALLAEEGA